MTIARITTEAEALQEWGHLLASEVEELITECLTYSLWEELAELLQYEHALKSASTGERKRYGWDMIEGGQPT